MMINILKLKQNYLKTKPQIRKEYLNFVNYGFK